jgi:hypothetical protein
MLATFRWYRRDELELDRQIETDTFSLPCYAIASWEGSLMTAVLPGGRRMSPTRNGAQSPTSQSTPELERAIDFLQNYLRRVATPIEASELFAEGAGHRLPATAMQLALWELVRNGEVKLTSDWRIQLPLAPASRR